jgi:hypothetical protein
MSSPQTPTAASPETEEDASSSPSYVIEEASWSGGLTSSLSAWVCGLAAGRLTASPLGGWKRDDAQIGMPRSLATQKQKNLTMHFPLMDGNGG